MKIYGVGVDLVNVARVRRFLDRHSSKKISRLLSPAEKKRYQKRKLSAPAFAKLFAAKEAFFKTLGMPWMGLEGFSCMEVKPASGGTFSVKAVSGPFAEKTPRSAQGCFFRAGNLLGAQVIRWGSGTES